MNITEFQMNQFQTARMKIVQNDIAKSSGNEALHKACGDFEAIFIKQMLDSMKDTINGTAFSEGGFGKEIYEDMLYTEYADKIAKTAHLGIAEMLYKQMTK